VHCTVAGHFWGRITLKALPFGPLQQNTLTSAKPPRRQVWPDSSTEHSIGRQCGIPLSYTVEHTNGGCTGEHRARPYWNDQRGSVDGGATGALRPT